LQHLLTGVVEPTITKRLVDCMEEYGGLTRLLTNTGKPNGAAVLAHLFVLSASSKVLHLRNTLNDPTSEPRVFSWCKPFPRDFAPAG
jgi:hypothetical protein